MWSVQGSIIMPKSDIRAAASILPQSSEHPRRPRIETSVEKAILAAAFEHPGHGQDRVARELVDRGIRVSASGVRYVWQRHDIETIDKRVSVIESTLGEAESAWTEEQRATRNRIDTIRQTRKSAGFSASRADNLSRSTFILAVAARLLRENSYDATSLRDIARAAGIPVGSLYYHFQTKEDLFAAVYSEGIRRLTVAVQQAIGRFRDPWKRLEAACATHLQELCAGDDFTAAAIPTDLPRLSRAIREKLAGESDSYEMILRDLIGQIPIPAKTSRSLVRLQILGALNWTRVWFKPDQSSAQEIARQFVRTLRYGLDPKFPKDHRPGNQQAQ
jgi:AcrR family transcriptional regulator